MVARRLRAHRVPWAREPEVASPWDPRRWCGRGPLAEGACPWGPTGSHPQLCGTVSLWEVTWHLVLAWVRTPGRAVAGGRGTPGECVGLIRRSRPGLWCRTWSEPPARPWVLEGGLVSVASRGAQPT